MIHSILVTCIDFLRRNQLLISLTLLYFFFQQTECLIRASMTLLKVPFIFPKYFFCSQQATFVKVSKVYFVVFFVCTCVTVQDDCARKVIFWKKWSLKLCNAVNFSFDWTKSEDFCSSNI